MRVEQQANKQKLGVKTAVVNRSLAFFLA